MVSPVQGIIPDLLSIDDSVKDFSSDPERDVQNQSENVPAPSATALVSDPALTRQSRVEVSDRHARERRNRKDGLASRASSADDGGDIEEVNESDDQPELDVRT